MIRQHVITNSTELRPIVHNTLTFHDYDDDDDNLKIRIEFSNSRRYLSVFIDYDPVYTYDLLNSRQYEGDTTTFDIDRDFNKTYYENDVLCVHTSSIRYNVDNANENGLVVRINGVSYDINIGDMREETPTMMYNEVDGCFYIITHYNIFYFNHITNRLTTYQIEEDGFIFAYDKFSLTDSGDLFVTVMPEDESSNVLYVSKINFVGGYANHSIAHRFSFGIINVIPINDNLLMVRSLGDIGYIIVKSDGKYRAYRIIAEDLIGMAISDDKRYIAMMTKSDTYHVIIYDMSSLIHHPMR